MTTPTTPDRSILVFAIWAVAGFLGLGFILEGMMHDEAVASGIGVGLVISAFIAHIIVNAVFHQGFTRGETALGIGVYGLTGFVFILAFATGRLGVVGYTTGIALFGLIAAGFLAYLVTRFGMRGAFSQFHVHAASAEETRR